MQLPHRWAAVWGLLAHRHRVRSPPQLIKDKPEGFYNGGSCIVAPDGSWVLEPQIGGGRLIVAEIDPTRIAAARHSFDPTGHYARPDVFQVTVDRRRQIAAAFTD